MNHTAAMETEYPEFKAIPCGMVNSKAIGDIWDPISKRKKQMSKHIVNGFAVTFRWAGPVRQLSG